ncbi:MAG: HlyD family efflux transporter periplasmic adaptor subunit [Clostridiales bacterium]
MNKKKMGNKLIIGLFIIVAVGVTAAYFLNPSSAKEEEIEVSKGDITTYYNFSGNIEAKNKEIVYADKSMQIDEIKVKEGQKINKDDVLFTNTMEEEIKAGIKGEIADIKIEKDQQVMPGAEIINIIDYDNLQLNIKIDEYDLKSVEKGKETNIKIHALDKEINGKIEEISKEGTEINGVTYFNALVSVEKDEKLRVGMSAEVKILDQKASNINILPMSAISFDDNNNTYVYIKKEDESVKRKIKVGITDGINVQIKEGIKLSDTVIIKEDAAENIGPGQFRENSNDSSSTTTTGSSNQNNSNANGGQ